MQNLQERLKSMQAAVPNNPEFNLPAVQIYDIAILFINAYLAAEKKQIIDAVDSINEMHYHYKITTGSPAPFNGEGYFNTTYKTTT